MEREQRLVTKKGTLSRVGQAAHDVVLSDVLLQNNQNPEVKFGMTEEMVDIYTAKRDAGVKKLKLPEEGRQERIDELKQQLIDQGFPHWRIK